MAQPSVAQVSGRFRPNERCENVAVTDRLPRDDDGRVVWIVTWGRPGRVDWLAVLATAFDPDEALELARRAYPGRLPPDSAVLAAPSTARAVLAGQRVAHLPVVAR
jgi:hypothetical protein